MWKKFLREPRAQAPHRVGPPEAEELQLREVRAKVLREPRLEEAHACSPRQWQSGKERATATATATTTATATPSAASSSTVSKLGLFVHVKRASYTEHSSASSSLTC